MLKFKENHRVVLLCGDQLALGPLADRYGWWEAYHVHYRAAREWWRQRLLHGKALVLCTHSIDCIWGLGEALDLLDFWDAGLYRVSSERPAVYFSAHEISTLRAHDVEPR